MDFGTGLTGSVVGKLYAPNGQYSAGGPAATSVPEGQPTLVAAAFGVGPEGTGARAGVIASVVSLASWAGLIYLWWVLPK